MFSLAIGLVIGVAVGYFFARSHSLKARMGSTVDLQQAAAQVPQLREQLAQAQRKLDSTSSDLSQSQQDLAYQKSKAEELTSQVEYLKQQLADLQHAEQRRVEESQQQKIAAQQEQSKILQALSPVSANLESLRKKVSEIEGARQAESGKLAARLQSLGHQQEMLNTETTKLASVLKDNKQRGHWGEVQLKNIVEAAGLVEHVDFDTQMSVDNTRGGTDRPDMVIHLPGSKIIPVDAKAPFTQYERAQNIPDTAPDAEITLRDRYLKEHARNLRSHIDELAKRSYWEDFAESTDFVVAFIPNESWLSAALTTDPSLLDYAFAHRVALCSPVSLWSVLKSVVFSWQQQSLSEDARKLLDTSDRIYKGFCTFGKYMSDLGGDLTKTVRAYNKVIGNVQRTILPPARQMQRMSPESIAPVDYIDEDKGDVRELTAPEFVSDASADEHTDD
ncbi:MAG: DNA recombination protein RmuC [Aeriscardovia sp.]|nr:DNA recombination protein RmuC [Aeriscardovia sp.]